MTRLAAASVVDRRVESRGGTCSSDEAGPDPCITKCLRAHVVSTRTLPVCTSADVARDAFVNFHFWFLGGVDKMVSILRLVTKTVVAGTQGPLYDVAIRRHVGEGVAVVAVQVKLLDSTATAPCRNVCSQICQLANTAGGDVFIAAGHRPHGGVVTATDTIHPGALVALYPHSYRQLCCCGGRCSCCSCGSRCS